MNMLKRLQSLGSRTVRGWGCAIAVLAGFASIEWPRESSADDRLRDVRTVRVIPRGPEELAQAHERSRSQSCEPVPPGEPLEIRSFAPALTDRDQAEIARGTLLLPSTRRNAFTVGLDMLSSDKTKLPKVSGGQILKYIQGHYVTVQARVQKDPGTEELFLHHRPLAATLALGRGNLTAEFQTAVLSAVRDFHSLGLYLPGSTPRRPENLRTLVLLFRNTLAVPLTSGGKDRLQAVYEYVFIRARETTSGKNKELAQYAFATSDQRRRLHLLRPWQIPNRSTDCGVRATVFFTDYSTLGLVPSKAATRNVSYGSDQVLEWTDLERFVRDQGWKGDVLDNLTPVLDAIVDERIQRSAGTGAGLKAGARVEGM